MVHPWRIAQLFIASAQANTLKGTMQIWPEEMADPDFNSGLTIGPALVGAMTASFLFGCAVLQTYGYYRHFPSDPKVLKGLVAALILLTFGHITCIMTWMWSLVVSSFGEPDEITIFSRPRTASVILTPFIAILSQSFFVFRLFRLSHSFSLLLLCAFLSVLNIAGTLVNAAKILDHSLVSSGRLNAPSWLTVLTVACGGACDLIITMGLVYNLRIQQSTSKLPQQALSSQLYRTANLFDKLTLWTIETGLVTSIATLLIIIFYCLMRHTFAWIGAFTVLADVYANTLLAALNSRTAVRKHTFVLENFRRNAPDTTQVPYPEDLLPPDGTLTADVVVSGQASSILSSTKLV
ncbi:hypothetical protein PAXRUDRAFT_10099 [Paxillus rubicundulus Ve08.2h10]|uniref:DUF6534 domain-containing protein n=1 Tax=Paxillus rubicundulus Ve08.2h10 TaxID=930991 RepID=A0A0D0EBG5_9AGAM|nr:hypothetical protein PAXRUDRAFT_10099 [Paxillus rubicundulus Ve08.2h10]